MNRPIVQSQITFLYYDDLAAAAAFYENVMGFERVEDQGFAKIYQVQGSAFVGIVSGERGFHQAQEKNAVLLTFVVDDVEAWYAYLKEQGVKIVRELQYVESINIKGFFGEDPGGYSFEVQQFLTPEVARIFAA
ncbi:MAG TPA: VOC family protein [Chloroflexi bacterium]|nr:VOC family protein [Chloroflexota bacterium]